MNETYRTAVNMAFPFNLSLCRSDRHSLLGGTTVLGILLAPVALAQDAGESRLTYGMFGTPSLIEMPTAESAPDAQLAATVSHFAGTTRTTLTFQLTPRLSASFRYASIDGLLVPGYNVDRDLRPLDPLPAGVNPDTFYDRSFDIRYRILDEGRYRPAVAIGLQDFIGTGLYGGEYVVATKSLTPTLKATAGLGWGRLGSNGSIATFGTRPTQVIGEGGIPTYDRWFRGDMAPFGGIAWSPTDRLTLKAEYSSDAYTRETRSGIFQRESSWNFGVDYMLSRNLQVSLYSLYGDEVGMSFTVLNNVRQSAVPGGAEGAPVPVRPRAVADIRDLGWTTEPGSAADIRSRLKAGLETEGLQYEGLNLDGTSATLRLRNTRYNNEPQALGRAARVMTRILPGSVETLRIVPVVNGVAASAVTFRRSDLEQLENAPADALLARTTVSDGYRLAPAAEQGVYPQFTWSLQPYFQLSVFDPDNPVRADAGLRLQGTYKLRPNIELSGSLTKKVTGNLDSVTRPIPSDLPRVRTDYAEYSKQGDPALEHLTLSGFGRPGPDLFSRVTVGYLEQMYAGVSGELLWKPVDSRLALGAEVNWVKQRDFDQRFGLRDYSTVTGHLSAYYDFGNGFHGQLDAGRYLGGDVGATVALDREFANGWRVGAYATFTDVAFDDFGEGSFDKGLRVTVPVQALLGQPSRRSNTISIQSLTRDGGARVNVRDRLYPRVREYHLPEMTKEWGRVWR